GGTVPQFQLFNDEIERIGKILKEFLKNSAAKAAILTDISGVVMSKQGFVQRYDVEAIAVLSANAISATRQMASIIGESIFNEVIFNGKRNNTYITVFGDTNILVTIFDNSTTLGLVRLYAYKASEELNQIISKIKERSEKT
ncbi:MAG: roadblock/LC7 domain-containing protein, partial [bacterium]